ncbi:MAG: glycerate kinase [Rhodoferax sp.]|uniref:glycerate kinase n=1 Tax=Rhodoferax sp. TaxID=50421 RepID=UPI0027158A20|nr:glycerate kinase [Rhodoferax sp.]MDO8449554.1 glycerate kinase [Rhodoferax sp.]
MQFQKILVPLASAALLVAAHHFYGWAGVAVAAGALVMWLLLHFTRMMQILKRAANRPIGFVDSAVMLNAKLRPGVTLLHVVAMTRSLGELVSPKDTQPEVFRWTDGTESRVTGEFWGGKLKKWDLVRPPQTDKPQTDTAISPAP